VICGLSGVFIESRKALLGRAVHLEEMDIGVRGWWSMMLASRHITLDASPVYLDQRRSFCRNVEMG
jgi:hypothetical protein